MSPKSRKRTSKRRQKRVNGNLPEDLTPLFGWVEVVLTPPGFTCPTCNEVLGSALGTEGVCDDAH